MSIFNPDMWEQAEQIDRQLYPDQRWGQGEPQKECVMANDKCPKCGSSNCTLHTHGYGEAGCMRRKIAALTARVEEALQMAESGVDMSECPACEQVVRILAVKEGE